MNFLKSLIKRMYLCSIVQQISNKSLFMDNNIEKQKLLELMQDTESFDELSKWSNTVNIFDVLKISRTEIRHSNLLGWLLDANENHGIGDAFLYSVFVKVSNSLDIDLSLKLLSSDPYTYSVSREWKDIDILLVSDKYKIILAIENKIGAHEHNYGKSEESQLETYETLIDNFYSDYDKIFVYLTPDGEIPTRSHWIVMTYLDLLDLLQKTYESKKTGLKDEVNLLINNYITNLKNNVIMDQELITLCKRIYQKHKVALDLIYENRDDDTLRISNICREVLSAKRDDYGIELPDEKTKSNIRFNTTSLNNYFTELTFIDDYFYQFQIRMKDDYFLLELVYHNSNNKVIEGELLKKMNNLTSKQINKEKWEWKRAWSHKITNISNMSDEEIKNSINDCLKKMSTNEKKIENRK